jgi:DNA-binding MarR family transcriptional regulator
VATAGDRYGDCHRQPDEHWHRTRQPARPAIAPTPAPATDRVGCGPTTKRRCAGGEGRLGIGREIGDQLVQIGVGLGLEAAAVAVGELVGVQAAGHMVAAQDVSDRIAIGVGGSQTSLRRLAPRVPGDVLGHVDPFQNSLRRLYSSIVDNQENLKNISTHIARLAPLLPQLAFAIRRRAGAIPPELQGAGRRGGRHIATLVSLGVAGPTTVSELARRMDMSTAHASLVVGDLARAGLVTREHDDKDRRRVTVSLSDKAKPALAQLRDRHAAVLAAFLTRFDNDQQASGFIDHLTELVAYLNAEPSATGRRPPATRRSKLPPG